MLQTPETAIDLAKQLGISGVVALLLLDRFFPFLSRKDKGLNGSAKDIERRLIKLEEGRENNENDIAELKKTLHDVNDLVQWLRGRMGRGDFRR